MHPTEIKIQEALQYTNEYIEFLATRSDDELSRRVDTNRFQYEIAYKNNDAKLCEFMEIMFHIIVQARIYKDEQNIPTQVSEIEEAVSQMEYIASPFKEIKEELNQPQRIFKAKIQEDNSQQISLF